MTIKEKLDGIFETCFCNKDKVLHTVLPTGFLVRDKQQLIDEEGKPFSFNDSYDLLIYAQKSKWINTDKPRDYGSVVVEIPIAYSNNAYLTKVFIDELMMNGITVDSIDSNTKEILKKYFFRDEKDDKYPLNYRALLVTCTFTNIYYEDYL